MAGREGLVDTAVKTSRSGYLQRCLVKHLEVESQLLSLHFPSINISLIRNSRLDMITVCETAVAMLCSSCMEKMVWTP